LRNNRWRNGQVFQVNGHSVFPAELDAMSKTFFSRGLSHSDSRGSNAVGTRKDG
jgi:hypothetical protein